MARSHSKKAHSKKEKPRKAARGKAAPSKPVLKKHRAGPELRSAIDEQREANLSTSDCGRLFAEHRRQLSSRLVRDVAEDSSARLCVLGAGNCNDLDLPLLARHFREIHLVDLDDVALKRAFKRQSAAVQQRLVRHAPLDVSGMLDKLQRWKRFQVTPEELLRHPLSTAKDLARKLGGPFEVVASACMLTQLQLGVLTALTDQHQLFQAVTQTSTLTHLKALWQLTCPGGRAVLATELVSNLTAPLDTAPLDTAPLDTAPLDTENPTPNELPTNELRRLFDELVTQGNVIAVSHPDLLTAALRDDPQLSGDVGVDEHRPVWLWQQGPERRYLVYTLEFVRRPRTSGRLDA